MKIINIILQIFFYDNIFKINLLLKKILLKYKFNIDIMWNTIISKDTIIWKHTYIWYNCWITKAIIWNYCSIANNVSIWMWEHDLNNISTNSIFYNNSYDDLTKLDCIIWNDVWIWVDSIIRRWIKIWNWAVIWANSFINSDIPPYAVVVWNPWKVIKYRFEQEKINKIEQTKWWEYDKINANNIINKINYENNR